MTESTVELSTEVIVGLSGKVPIRVLHVDDDPGFLKVAKQLLKMQGSFYVETALSVKEAMRKMRMKAFDVVVSDYMMPERDGLEFLKGLRRKGVKVSFIMFTGRGREEVAIEALNYGVDQYINKHGDPETVYAGLACSIRKAVENRRAEEELCRERDFNRTLVQASPTFFVAISADGKILLMNEAFLDAVGYTVEEIVGRDYLSTFVPESDRDLLSSVFRKLVDSRESTLNETRVMTKDGRELLVEWHGRPVLKADGELDYFFGVGIDITERKQVEEQLRKSEGQLSESLKKLNLVLSTLEEGIDIVSYDYVVLYQNRLLKERFGDITGKKCYVEYMGFRKPCSSCPMRKAIKHKKTFRTELKGKDGRDYEIISMPLEYADGHVDALEIVRDITERKRMEEVLRKSEEKYRFLYENSAVVNMIIGMDGIIKDVNKQLVEKFGYSRDEIVGKHALEFVVPEQREKVAKALMRSLKEDQTPEMDVEICAKDGTVCTILFSSGQAVFYEGGQPTGVLLTGIDVTERREAEQEIRESREKFESLFMSNPEATVFVNPDFHILEVNPSFTELFNYSLGEVRGKHINDIIVPQNKMEEAKELDKKNRKGYIFHDTVRKRKDGTLVPVSISAAPITVEGKFLGYIGLYKNITARVKAEEEREESRRHFQTLFNVMVDPVVIVDGKGKILEVTERVEEITGFKREELIGKNFLSTKIVTTKSKAILMKNLVKRMMGLHPVLYEIEIVTKDGRKLPYEVNGIKIEYKGEPADMVSFRDISERKKMHEKLHVVGRLTRHDVRNKLSTVTGNVYLAKQRLKSDPKTMKYLEAVESAIKAVKKILNFAGTYEKLGIEKLVYMDVEKTVEEAFSFFQDLHVKLVDNCYGLSVLADSLLRQLFYNLVDNSLEHGEKVSQIRVHYKACKDHLELVYEDDGVGIPKAEKEKVFKEDYGKGTGYGLCLIKRMCEVYGWTIRETGKYGKGVEFTMTIPKVSENGKTNYRLSQNR